jgi:broad specificity phosphatase PhoE
MTIWLVRHGETQWSLSGQHTGSTDIPLTQQGRLQAVAIGKLLVGRPFDHVFSSPTGRAIETGTLAGFGDRIQLDERLREFDYGEFEGRTTVEIWATHPGWEIFRDGCPGGETPNRRPSGPTRFSRSSASWRAASCCSDTATVSERSPRASSTFRSARRPACNWTPERSRWWATVATGPPCSCGTAAYSLSPWSSPTSPRRSPTPSLDSPPAPPD